jgi:hypothetical protein
MGRHLIDQTAEFRLPQTGRHAAPETGEMQIVQRQQPADPSPVSRQSAAGQAR